MPSPSSTTSDAPLGTFEEQVLLAVLRTGRAPDGSGAYGMVVRRELEEVAGREVAIGAVYGMNFDNMPELHTRYGYFVVLAVMISGMISVAVYFRRKHWL